MARPTRMTGEERREQIIDKAIELFSANGFTGTTTRRLSEAAGVSEAALYMHFDTKEALYEAIIRRKARDSASFTERLDALAESPPEEFFGAVARFMLETHSRDTGFLRLLLYSGLERHALFQMFFESQVREMGDRIRSYIERQQQVGAFRPCDPRIAVRAFMGMLVHHLLVQEVFKVRELGVFGLEQVAPVFVTIFLDGLRPTATSETPSRSEAACV